ncbi:ADP-ribosylglycohydrolase family protein [Candidatus Woesearchaeota archaeon]|nr:ADP-ribosylglycohydrolase family protein [Candidatus Woesearchaeota archaeon]
MTFVNKIISSFEHLATGDALGKICSKYTTDEVIEIYGHKITGLKQPVRRTSIQTWNYGAITDDTILTKLVMDSLIKNKEFDRKDFAADLMICDPKGGTQIKKFKSSNNLEYVALDGETNGGAIRTLGLAVIHDNANKLTKDVIKLTTLTHGTLESISATLLTAYAQQAALRDIANINEYMLDTLQTYFPEGKHTKVIDNFHLATKIFSEHNSADMLDEMIGFTKYAWTSVPCAIATGILANNTYDEFINIIHRNQPNRDLDTMASIAGSIMGARKTNEKVKKISTEIGLANNIDFIYYGKELKKLRDKYAK